jgi:N utilization substance protein B
MKRRRAREYALQLLFQLDLTKDELTEEVLRDFWEGNREDREVMEFTYDIVKGTLENIATIDEIIKQAAEHWPLERMAVIDRNILRAATYELRYRMDIPPSVTINEAIEISKKYSTEDSASFINGILDRIAHTDPVAAKKTT